MHVFMKRLLFLMGAVLVLLLASFIYHRLALQREKASLNPMGQMVSVNGHDMSVFVKGNGPQTLVFLSGAGTASPILDFKDLYDGLSKQYKIVVVERAGYGYSEDTSKSRDVSEVLSETRQALAKAHVSGPYIILSHSMASLETLLWQEKYPSEIQAIIGLDWALPESYSQLRMHSQILRMARLGSQLGLLRYIPSRLYVPNENLSSSDRRLYQRIAYRQILSQAMLNESLSVKGNAKKVDAKINSQISTLLLVSNGEGTSFSKEEWRNYATRFAKDQKNIELTFYDAPHYLYHYRTKEVVAKIEDFIKGTTD
ncbi:MULTISPECIES: alpha/beta fold hydrolase [Streptococcus]|uniref:Alpha/beta hydrolase n=1 Tax=Streptococcus salivarius TaxID=1304 RepID=A0A6A8UBM3_STRSL|nr:MULTISPECIES: alpha/beta hydrolase [Streptococcus]MTQ89520.1 alpha/beta hydrolase [Streptococcus salivarius]MTR27097.1 alpha/beta hydrolase [Streptococcus salivarius]MTR38348.1 alpha/beta hydrolase [Streptococcus salivarius]